MNQKPIDVVITWVDGYDPSHQKKIADYFSHLGIEKPKSIESTRFNQLGEIEYCLTSIQRFAPWIRTIYIVTDKQIPPIYGTLQHTEFGKKIKIIDHRDIFRGYESALPVFNSLAIEWMLWRIEGLAEHFIYFNDDCFLLRPVKPNDFFQADKLVVRGEWKRFSNHKWCFLRGKLLNKSTTIDDHRWWQEQSAKLAGLNKRFFHLPHAPLPLKKQTFIDFFQQHPAVVRDNICHAFRDRRQVWPISLAYHLEIQQNQVIFNHHLRAIMINGAFHTDIKIKARLAQIEHDHRIAFLCVQSLDQTPGAMQEYIDEWLKKYISRAPTMIS